ncbi:hypothetical protein T02_14639 [Trichinella nativa]|uniref:Uncharacterized protein n=1 Tax=Trichinella nativa TaxID=6335 RepID=A0A0V1KPR3_9BILA|nr:hypothetical protein T02_14639 [Trichinella nativa]
MEVAALQVAHSESSPESKFYIRALLVDAELINFLDISPVSRQPFNTFHLKVLSCRRRLDYSTLRMVGRVPNLSIRTGLVSNRLFYSHFPHTSVQCLLFYAYTVSSFSESFLRKSLARSELSGSGPKSTLQRKITSHRSTSNDNDCLNCYIANRHMLGLGQVQS